MPCKPNTPWLAAILFCLVSSTAGAEPVTFTLAQPGHVTARLTLASPGSAWGGASPAAVADVLVDGKPNQQVVLFAGPREYTYEVLLGRLAGGTHRLDVVRNGQFSARESGLDVLRLETQPAAPGSEEELIAEHAPILLPRSGTLENFSDLPLLVYAERFTGASGTLLRYSVVFSNEDGGTSTRALMARWGRTLDIEWAYEVRLDQKGQRLAASFQGKGHEEMRYEGLFEGNQPILAAETLNNMLVPAPALRLPAFRLAPKLVRLVAASREAVVDGAVFYRAMSEELDREGKLRPFGTRDGEKISDPRNYLYLELNVRNRGSAIAVWARRQGDANARSSHLGDARLAVERSGWARVAIEMPPGTKAAEIAEIGLLCEELPKKHDEPQPTCEVDRVSKAFFLNQDYSPGAVFWRWSGEEPVVLPAGGLRGFSLRGVR